MDFAQIKRYVEQFLEDTAAGAWITQVFLVVLAVVIVNFIVRRVLGRVQQQAGKSSNVWDDALVDALGKPLNLMIWVVGLSFAADIIRAKTQEALFDAVDPIRAVGVIVCIMWFLVRLIANIETSIIQREQLRGKDVDPTTVHALGKLVRLAVIITSALVGLQTLGFSVSGVLAFGGIGGIAIGFAAKDLLANFFGGLMIYLDRPFAVGDWIRSPDRNIEGTVENIGWRLTRIRTFDKRPLYVPNAVFATIGVENPSRMTHRRIYETIGIRYDDVAKMAPIVEGVKSMLRAHDEIDQGQTMIVNFNAFNASSVDFFVYTFTKTTDWAYYHQVKQDVLLKISEVIESHGAQIAFPTRTLHVNASVPFAGLER